MHGDIWDVEVSGDRDGVVKRAGLGHAWVWERRNGKKEVFDCGLTASRVMGYMAVRLKVEPRAVLLSHPD